MAQNTYSVTGMTCDHCVASVKQEVSAIPGVQAVDVTLVAGGQSTVTVTSEQQVDHSAVKAAVDEAGYEVVATR